MIRMLLCVEPVNLSIVTTRHAGLYQSFARYSSYIPG
jgi:hypothetical protein